MTSLGPYVETSPAPPLIKPAPMHVSVNSIAGLIASEPDFSIFRAIVWKAGMFNFLASPLSKFTVFVPSDALLRPKINEQAVKSMDIGKAIAIVKASILKDVIDSSILQKSSGRVFATINRSAPLIVRNVLYDSGGTKLTTLNGNSNIVFFNIKRGNGMVHVVDNLIAPSIAPLL